MQTSAISYRVADFLKQHPPFHLMEEADLLALVARGRVKFHERDEFLCWQGSTYTPFLLVIQQGAVSLWEEGGGKESLRDIRGPGDMIGVERYAGSQKYPYSAKAAGDVVVYALPAADFEPLLGKYPAAARYVDAHAAAGAVYQDADRQHAHRTFVAELASHPEPLSCAPDCTVAEAARIMHQAGADAIAVMQDRNLLGVVTASDALAWVAEGGPASQTVREIMSGIPPSVAPQTLVSDCVLAMAEGASKVVALTADGTPNGGLLRLVAASDLQPTFGDNPVTFLHQIAHASDIEALRVLHLRARAFLLEHLDTPRAVDWLAALADRLNVSIAKRLLDLAGNASADWCWCFWGAAGRRELLTTAEPGVAIVTPDPSGEAPARAALDRLRSDLVECGYASQAMPEWEAGFACAAASTWQERFALWVSDPVLTQMYEARPLFDLRPAFGNLDLWLAVDERTSNVIRAEPTFLKLLAHDCMSRMPPLTFFEDAVVDESGERAEIFELEQHALSPIVEVGRVFGIATGRALGSSTLERLERARMRMPAEEAIFREAAETLRLLLFLQTRSGLRKHDSGAHIAPAQLSRFDRQALKSGFRSLQRLLEFTAKRQWMKTI